MAGLDCEKVWPVVLLPPVHSANYVVMINNWYRTVTTFCPKHFLTFERYDHICQENICTAFFGP